MRPDLINNERWLNPVDQVEPLIWFVGSSKREVVLLHLRGSTSSRFSLNLLPRTRLVRHG